MKPLKDIIENATKIAKLEGTATRPDDWPCEHCGRLTGGKYTICQHCVHELNHRRRAKRIDEARARIPASFLDFDPPTFDPRRLIAQQICESLSKGLSVLAWGPSGAGKTTTAALAIRTVVDRFVFEVASQIAWASAYDIAQARLEHRLGADEAPLVREAKRASILVLDELGSEQARTTAVQEVIHERNAEALPMIVTTWLDMDGMRERYGDGITRRLLERSNVFSFG